MNPPFLKTLFIYSEENNSLIYKIFLKSVFIRSIILRFYLKNKIIIFLEDKLRKFEKNKQFKKDFVFTPGDFVSQDGDLIIKKSENLFQLIFKKSFLFVKKI